MHVAVYHRQTEGAPHSREFHPENLEPQPQRLRHEGIADAERNWSTFTHLSPIAGLFVQGVVPIPLLPLLLPLFIWLAVKRESVFNDDHGREVVNFCISFVLLHIITGITIIGIILWPVLWIVALVNLIRGAVAASRGEYFRYPMTFRFIS